MVSSYHYQYCGKKILQNYLKISRINFDYQRSDPSLERKLRGHQKLSGYLPLPGYYFVYVRPSEFRLERSLRPDSAICWTILENFRASLNIFTGLGNFR